MKTFLEIFTETALETMKNIYSYLYITFQFKEFLGWFMTLLLLYLTYKLAIRIYKLYLRLKIKHFYLNKKVKEAKREIDQHTEQKINELNKLFSQREQMQKLIS